MFDKIERAYQKNLQEKRFIAYYWPRALVIVLLVIVLNFLLGFQHWSIYGGALAIFIGLVIFFFYKEYRHAHKTMESVRQHKVFSAKLAEYFRVDDKRRIDELVRALAAHNFHTKSDLELALSYFQSRLPTNTKPNLLEWIFTAVITLSSIVIVSYDSTVNAINVHRLLEILIPTVSVVLIILAPFIIAKIIMVWISKSRNKADTSLVQDLAYIYVNYDKFRTKLEAKTAASISPAVNTAQSKK